MQEIITLQFGQSSNYLATHFWNAQESYFTYDGEKGLLNHDIHFRPGISASGTETFTPRTLIYDLKGGFGSLKKINALYEIEEEKDMPKGLWDGQSIIQRETPIEQHPYQRSLDEGLKPQELTTGTVRFWSDFNRVFYHPRSIIQLNEFELNSTLMPFEKWGVGEELFSSLDKEHDLLDRDLRPFAEESDHLQALQVMTGVDNAWGGFATRYLERLRDEFGKTSIWVWGLESGCRNGREKHQSDVLNLARSLQGMSPQASLYVPLEIPPKPLPFYVSLDRESEWHRSGLLSTALETMTLPSRLEAVSERQVTLTQMEGCLNTNGSQKIACLQLSVLKPELQKPPGSNGSTAAANDPRQTGSLNKEDAISAGPAALDMNLSPRETGWHQKGLSSKIHTFGQLEVVRSKVGGMTSVDNSYQLRQRKAGSPVVQRYSTTLGLPSLDSSPRLFWSQEPQSAHAEDSLTVHTSLSMTSSVTTRIKSIQSVIRKLVGIDEREALLNELGEIREAYEEGWDSGTDEDDD
ncbi:MAG: mtDNA inheritance, partitioning of the mitochondrial organelle [Trichoglossum hirsutum]|nr:MAG: mtDNA inheritance, partitioning of the mitochondrial organelle [Trichoglossum hirsutum]